MLCMHSFLLDCTELLEKAQYAGAGLICLCEHGLRSLHEHVVLRVFRHFLGDIGVADRGLCRRYILAGCRQVAGRVLETALYRANGGLLIECLLDSAVHDVDGCIRMIPRRDIDCREVAVLVRALETKSKTSHIRETGLDGLACLRANLQVDGVIRGFILCADSLAEVIEQRVDGLLDIAVRSLDGERKTRNLSCNTGICRSKRQRRLAAGRILGNSS